MRVDAHHHLWDLEAVHYPWLMEHGKPRFFGNPAPIQRNYLLPEFRQSAEAHGFEASIHIQVGAHDAWEEAKWVQRVADAAPDWPLAQVVFCDLTSEDLEAQLKRFSTLPTVRGVRQIIGRAPGEDASTGSNTLLRDPRFVDGLKQLPENNFSFDLQLLPELMADTAAVLRQAPDTKIALCHAGSPYQRDPRGLQNWQEALKTLSSLPQVYCKLSGLGMFDPDWNAASVAPIFETCITQFGADRVMFGSNFPVCSLTSDYATLVKNHRTCVPEEIEAKVFGSTAQHFYLL